MYLLDKVSPMEGVLAQGYLASGKATTRILSAACTWIGQTYPMWGLADTESSGSLRQLGQNSVLGAVAQPWTATACNLAQHAFPTCCQGDRDKVPPSWLLVAFTHQLICKLYRVGK